MNTKTTKNLIIVSLLVALTLAISLWCSGCSGLGQDFKSWLDSFKPGKDTTTTDKATFLMSSSTNGVPAEDFFAIETETDEDLVKMYQQRNVIDIPKSITFDWIDSASRYGIVYFKVQTNEGIVHPSKVNVSFRYEDENEVGFNEPSSYFDVGYNVTLKCFELSLKQRFGYPIIMTISHVLDKDLTVDVPINCYRLVDSVAIKDEQGATVSLTQSLRNVTSLYANVADVEAQLTFDWAPYIQQGNKIEYAGTISPDLNVDVLLNTNVGVKSQEWAWGKLNDEKIFGRAVNGLSYNLVDEGLATFDITTNKLTLKLSEFLSFYLDDLTINGVVKNPTMGVSGYWLDGYSCEQNAVDILNYYELFAGKIIIYVNNKALYEESFNSSFVYEGMSSGCSDFVNAYNDTFDFYGKSFTFNAGTDCFDDWYLDLDNIGRQGNCTIYFRNGAILEIIDKTSSSTVEREDVVLTYPFTYPTTGVKEDGSLGWVHSMDKVYILDWSGGMEGPILCYWNNSTIPMCQTIGWVITKIVSYYDGAYYVNMIPEGLTLPFYLS